MILYHFARKIHREWIARDGLRPDRSEGKIKRIWLAEAEDLFRVLNHLCLIYESHPSDFDLWQVEIRKAATKKSRWGYYYTRQNLLPSEILCLTNKVNGWSIQ
jgi:hypothetical protein